MGDLVKMTRGVYHCYVDSKGNLNEKPIGIIAKRNLDKERDSFLRKYITLIKDSKIVSNTTKIYMQSSLPSVALVISSHNQLLPEGEQINIKTAQSKVNYDSKKLLKYFPDNMLTQLLFYNSCNLSNYNKQLNLAISKYSSKNKMLDNLLIKLPNVEVQESLDEEEFREFISIIAPYIKKHREYVQNNLPEKALGHILYLLSTPQLTGENRERYDLLKEMLS